MNGTVEWVSWRLGLPYVLVRYEDLVEEQARITGELCGNVLPDAGLSHDGIRLLENEAIDLGVAHLICGNAMRFQQGHTAIVEDADWKTGPWTRRAVVSAITLPLRWRYGYRGSQR